MTGHTVDKDSEAQEGKVPLPFDGVPADVGVALHQKHGAALEATACQIGDHLQVCTASLSSISSLTTLILNACKVNSNPKGRVVQTLSRSGSSSASARPLLSMTEEAATSSGVDPLMAGEAATQSKASICCWCILNQPLLYKAVQTAGGSVSVDMMMTGCWVFLCDCFWGKMALIMLRRVNVVQKLLHLSFYSRLFFFQTVCSK